MKKGWPPVETKERTTPTLKKTRPNVIEDAKEPAKVVSKRDPDADTLHNRTPTDVKLTSGTSSTDSIRASIAIRYGEDYEPDCPS